MLHVFFKKNSAKRKTVKFANKYYFHTTKMFIHKWLNQSVF